MTAPGAGASSPSTPLTRAHPGSCTVGSARWCSITCWARPPARALTKPLFTGTLTVRFVRGTPLGRLRADAAVERTEGVKSFVSGHLSDGEGITVEAEGIFIKPAWARDAE